MHIMEGNQKSLLNKASQMAEKLRFSHKFYAKSYPDIENLDEASAKEHFINIGIHEKRYCSSYHFFKEKKPEYAGSISIKNYRKHNKIPQDISPLNTCELILSHLNYGAPSEGDAAFFQSPTKRSSIGKHGQISTLGRRNSTIQPRRFLKSDHAASPLRHIGDASFLMSNTPESISSTVKMLIS